jgi:hypothetical protein
MARSPTPTTAGTDHAALLTRVRKVRSAVCDGDLERLRREAGGLLAAFVAHVDAEAAELRQLGPRVAGAVLRGQRRLRREIIALAVESEAPDPSRCDRMAAHVEAVLEMQAARERRVLSTAAAAAA